MMGCKGRAVADEQRPVRSGRRELDPERGAIPGRATRAPKEALRRGLRKMLAMSEEWVIVSST